MSLDWDRSGHGSSAKNGGPMIRYGTAVLIAAVVISGIAGGQPGQVEAGDSPSLNARVRVLYTPQWYAQQLEIAQNVRSPEQTSGLVGRSATQNMTYHGGPIMQTHTAYTIFWTPTPGPSVAASIQSLINRWFGDLGGSALLAIATQYYQDDSPFYPFANVQNIASLGGTWVDTSNPYPHAGTTADPLLDSDIQAEVLRAIAANGWPSGGYNVEYFVYTAPSVESCFDDLSLCTPGRPDAMGHAYCAYHTAFGTCGSPTIYSNMPYGATWGCGAGAIQSPNGNLDADVEINLTSHEQFESMTDPAGCSGGGWFDDGSAFDAGSGEIGDKCAYRFGSPGVDGRNVTLNGHPYVVQQEWSNAAFDGTAYSGCVLPGSNFTPTPTPTGPNSPPTSTPTPQGSPGTPNPTTTCAPAPMAGCHKPTKTKAAALTLKKGKTSAKDTLTWKWGKGDATTSADLGDPRTSTNYVFCLYDDNGGVPSVVTELDAPAGPNRWGGGSVLIGYAQFTNDNGFLEVEVDTGIAGKAKVSVKAKGESLTLPTLPLNQNPSVVAQLQNSLGVCWEADYGSPAITNSPKKFSDKSD